MKDGKKRAKKDRYINFYSVCLENRRTRLKMSNMVPKEVRGIIQYWNFITNGLSTRRHFLSDSHNLDLYPTKGFFFFELYNFFRITHWMNMSISQLCGPISIIFVLPLICYIEKKENFSWTVLHELFNARCLQDTRKTKLYNTLLAVFSFLFDQKFHETLVCRGVSKIHGSSWMFYSLVHLETENEDAICDVARKF